MLRMSKWFGVTAAALLLAGFLCGPATAAEDTGSHPGSLLLFPYFSNEPGINTYIRVTNTAPVPFNPLIPEIRVHWIFFYLIPRTPPSRPVCNSVSSYDPLTPADTILTTSAAEAPGATRGFFIAKAVSPFAGGPDISWDFLIGDEIVLNTAEGWAWAINSIGILADQDSVFGAPIQAASPEGAFLSAPEAVFGGTDVDALDYEYINFPENFYFQYLTTRFARATDVLLLPLEREYPAAWSAGTPFLGDDVTFITPTTPPFARAAQYPFDVRYWDADEHEFSAPQSQIDCWDIRSVDTLTLGSASSVATRGYGWMTIYAFDVPGAVLPNTWRALALVLDRPTVGAVSDAFAEYPAQDWTPAGNLVPPYLSTVWDVSDM